MKEQIIEILETDLADGSPLTLGEIADKIIAAFAEAMPTEEESEKELLYNLDYVDSTVTAFFINGWKSHGVWFRSRMEEKK
jgi:hypothetical protein